MSQVWQCIAPMVLPTSMRDMITQIKCLHCHGVHNKNIKKYKSITILITNNYHSANHKNKIETNFNDDKRLTYTRRDVVMCRTGINTGAHDYSIIKKPT